VCYKNSGSNLHNFGGAKVEIFYSSKIDFKKKKYPVDNFVDALKITVG